jgi:hypothetical protein
MFVAEPQTPFVSAVEPLHFQLAFISVTQILCRVVVEFAANMK